MKKRLVSALAVLVASAVSAAGQKDYVTYEDYGAVGDGKHDDQAAIIAAHAAANKAGLPVRAADDKTYYIGGGKALAIIKTDTDWGTARFIIDDVKLEDLNKPVFVVVSRLKSYKLDGLKTLKKGQKRLAMKFPQKSLVLVVNKDKNVYIRKGLNRNKGHYQQELLLVEKNGRLYERALPIFDFDKVTDCTVFPVDEQPLTVKGGIFTTIANQSGADHRYHNRGISIRRSNVIVEGITHYVTGELEYGAPYTGFISTTNASDVIIRNCLLTAHKTYSKIGNANKPVSMGTYDLSFTTTINLHLENITQTNDITDRTIWGLMGSNYCKDIYMDNCIVSRFDAHQGVENVTLRNCTFGYMGVGMVGTGTIYMENCTVRTNFLVRLRSDYGSSWDGNIIVKNCTLRPTGGKEVLLLNGSNNGDHDFGYECKLPISINIDGLTIDDSAVRSPKYQGPTIFCTFDRDVTKAGLLPYKPTEKVILKNVTVVSGKELSVSANAEMFKNTKIVRK